MKETESKKCDCVCVCHTEGPCSCCQDARERNKRARGILRLQEVVEQVVKRGERWIRAGKDLGHRRCPCVLFNEGLYWEARAALELAKQPCGEEEAPPKVEYKIAGENPDPPPGYRRPKPPPPPPKPFGTVEEKPSMVASLLTLPSLTLAEMIENLRVGDIDKRLEAGALLTLFIEAGLRKLGRNEDEIKTALGPLGISLERLMEKVISEDASAMTHLKLTLLREWWGEIMAPVLAPTMTYVGAERACEAAREAEWGLKKVRKAMERIAWEMRPSCESKSKEAMSGA